MTFKEWTEILITILVASSLMSALVIYITFKKQHNAIMIISAFFTAIILLVGSSLIVSRIILKSHLEGHLEEVIPVTDIEHQIHLLEPQTSIATPNPDSMEELNNG